MTEELSTKSRLAESNLLVLALDTSTASLAAALVHGAETIGEVQSLAERNHSVHTVSIVKSLLEDNGITAEQLDGISIGIGPGSYTGMRIAVSVGKTLAWAWNKPLVGVSSLESLAFGAWQKVADPAEAAAESDSDSANLRQSGSEPFKAGSKMEWFIPIMDARRGQVYTAGFAAASDGAWNRLAKDGIRLMYDWVDELASRIRQLEDSDLPEAIWIVGDLQLHEAEADRLTAVISSAQQASASTSVNVQKLSFIMEGGSVAALGMKRLAAGEKDDIHSFIPNYTQLTEAEVNLRAKALKGLEGKKEGASTHDSQ
ncbi:tRNA (adenosine(37)-N6)-threonylcarbamoyltransferase complex dimerization subunit type 1 TsaB [Paenibacillus solisilvae]|uniref:tRNA (Adenosine(37)-N6)-threonylcarbamoyltransferase complex dimerization subunit type 1 TsaB n=1 Tax=Paenibacillus solisilvae TaxID=2486751 RepID=A0ABW0VNU4_9BACL